MTVPPLHHCPPLPLLLHRRPSRQRAAHNSGLLEALTSNICRCLTAQHGVPAGFVFDGDHEIKFVYLCI